MILYFPHHIGRKCKCIALTCYGTTVVTFAAGELEWYNDGQECTDGVRSLVLDSLRK